MPENLKIASLRPLLKKPNADCEQFSNFRPVSNLKFLSKLVKKSIFELLSRDKWLARTVSICVQSAPQYRNRTKLTITDDILLSLYWGDNVVFIPLLDLSAPFNHSLLLSRLENSFGITETILQCFHSKRYGRSQFVEINDTKSSVRDLTVGVPQGFVLGSILYLLYTALLAEIIRSHGIDHHFYADDTQLYISFKECDVDV